MYSQGRREGISLSGIAITPGERNGESGFSPSDVSPSVFPAASGSANLGNSILGICVYKIKLNRGKAEALRGRGSERRALHTAGHRLQWGASCKEVESTETVNGFPKHIHFWFHVGLQKVPCLSREEVLAVVNRVKADGPVYIKWYQNIWLQYSPSFLSALQRTKDNNPFWS